MSIDVIGQRLLTGRLVIAAVQIRYVQRILLLCRSYAQSRNLPPPPNTHPLRTIVLKIYIYILFRTGPLGGTFQFFFYPPFVAGCGIHIYKHAYGWLASLLLHVWICWRRVCGRSQALRSRRSNMRLRKICGATVSRPAICLFW